LEGKKIRIKEKEEEEKKDGGQISRKGKEGILKRV
jgi:hypothetical protein